MRPGILTSRKRQPQYRGFRDSIEGRGVTPTFVRATDQTELRSGVYVTSASGVDAHSDDGWMCHPARENILLQNRGFSDPVWVVTNTPTVAQDETGIDGVANKAFTLGDDNAVAFEAKTQSITVVNNGNSHAAHIFIKQDSDTSRFPEFQLKLIDGTTQTINTQINTSTGAKNDRTVTGTGVSSVTTLTINGVTWYRLDQYLTNNTSGNTTLQYIIYPAAGTTLGTIDATTTGTVVVDLPQVELNTTFTTSPIYTVAAGVTRNATDLSYTNILPVNDFVVSFDWTPYAAGQGTIGIFQCRQDANNLIKIDHNGTNIALRISVAGVADTAFKALSITANTTYRITIRCSSTAGRDIWVDGVKGTGDSTATDLVLGSDIYMGSLDGASHMSGAMSPPFSNIYLGDASDAFCASR